jgi:hypothetical protein
MAMPDSLSRNHRSNSETQSPSTSLICEAISTASDAINNIVEGINMDLSEDLENASDSIRVKCEFDSNVIDESDLQYAKHFDPRISTLRGIKID